MAFVAPCILGLARKDLNVVGRDRYPPRGRRIRTRLACHDQNDPEEISFAREALERMLKDPEVLEEAGLREADAETLNRVKELGEKEIRRLVDTLLHEGEEKIRLKMDEVGETETKKMLEEFDAKRDAVLDVIRKERLAVEKEVELIHSLASQLHQPSQEKTPSFQQSILRALSFIFFASSFYYLWEGFLTQNVAVGLRNAAINATVGAVATYVLRQRE